MTEAEWLASVDPVAMLDWRHDMDQVNPPPRGRGWGAVSERKLRLIAIAKFRALILPGETSDQLVKFEKWVERGALRSEMPDRDGWHLYDPPKDAAKYIPTGDGFPEDQSDLWPFDLAAFAHILRDIIGNLFRPVTLPVGEVCGDCEGDGKILTRIYQQRDRMRGVRKCEPCHGTGHGPSPVLTPLVRSLAQAACDERQENGTLDNERLVVLSDALEDAGLEGAKCERCEGDGKHRHKTVMGSGKVIWSKTGVPCTPCNGTGRQQHPILAHLRSPGPHYRGCWALDLILGKE